MAVRRVIDVIGDECVREGLCLRRAVVDGTVPRHAREVGLRVARLPYLILSATSSWLSRR